MIHEIHTARDQACKSSAVNKCKNLDAQVVIYIRAIDAVQLS